MGEQAVTKEALRAAVDELQEAAFDVGFEDNLTHIPEVAPSDACDAARERLLALIDRLPIPATAAEAELKAAEMEALHRYLEDHHHRKLLWMNDVRQPMPEPIYWPHPDWWPVNAPVQAGPDPQGDNS